MTDPGEGERGPGSRPRGGTRPERAPAVPVDRGTSLAEERTRLALRRTFLATERTLMAWVRTSLSMISFGFTIVKFFEYLAEERKMTLVGLFGRAWAPATLGLMLIVIGTFSLVAAIVEHRRSLKELHKQGLAPGWSLALIVACLVAVLGVFAFGSLIFHN
jgi:putative membrane protein